MKEIEDLVFADAVFECQISNKKCHLDGNCSECIVASYFIEMGEILYKDA